MVVPKFDANESVELLLKLAGQTDSSNGETAAARELAKYVGGLAIAIDILAKQILIWKGKIRDFLVTFQKHRDKLLKQPKLGYQNQYYDKDISTI